MGGGEIRALISPIHLPKVRLIRILTVIYVSTVVAHQTSNYAFADSRLNNTSIGQYE